MGELVWSLRDTHCVWCGLRLATGADDSRHDAEWEARDTDCDRDTCWCSAVCWGTCRESVFDEGTVAGLRALVEAQASVIARTNDGWDYVLPAADPGAEHGVYFRFQDGAGHIVMTADMERVPQEPMPPAEQIAVYGEVVRTEEADTDAD